MAKVAKDVYADSIKDFRVEEMAKLLGIDAARKNIAVCTAAIEDEHNRGKKPSPAVLAGYGHAATTYWLAQDRARRKLVKSIDTFEAMALGWFAEDEYQQKFTDGVAALKAAFEKLTEADKAVSEAYGALKAENLTGARDWAADAGTSAETGGKDIDAALSILDALLPSLSPTAKVQKKKPKVIFPADPLNPLTPHIPEEHRAAFAERLASFRLLKEQRRGLTTAFRDGIATNIIGLREALARLEQLPPPYPKTLPPLYITVTAAAKTSFSTSAAELRRSSKRDLDAFRAEAAGWFAQGSRAQDFAAAMTSMEKGFEKLTKAETTLIAAYHAIEKQIAAGEHDFSEAEKLSKEADAAANDGAIRIEVALSVLSNLRDDPPTP